MEMPRPTEQHRRLEAFVGSWRGEETLYPSQWMPEERAAEGAFEYHLGADGFFLISDYVESRDGVAVFRGHGVYGWDVRTETYTMYWFDSMGMPPQPVQGRWDGEAIVYQAQGPHGHARYTHKVSGDRYVMRIEVSPDGQDWKPMMEGRYHRVGT